jgi:hypothetical protein
MKQEDKIILTKEQRFFQDCGYKLALKDVEKMIEERK